MPGRGDDHPTRRHEHPPHLDDGAGPVLHEHQSHLAQDDVDRPIGEGQRCRIRDVPVDCVRGGNRLRNVDHVRSNVDAGDRSGGADAVGGQPRDQARPARDVEDSFARLQVGGLKQ
jgi:hypothetical protein